MSHMTECPSCNKKLEYISSQIGEDIVCSHCGFQFKLPVPKEVINPKKYKLPEEIEIHVCSNTGQPIKIENIILSIERGYVAGPFFTDKQGVVKITRKILEEEEKDWISTGGGDHRNFSLIGILNINILSRKAIQKWIRAKKYWNFLSDNEKKHWKNIDELIFAMKRANNDKLRSVSSILSLDKITGNEKLEHTLVTNKRRLFI